MAARDLPVTKVTVAKGPIRFPPHCCCCGAPSDRLVTIERRNPGAIPIPIPIPGGEAMVRLRRTLSIGLPSCATCEPGMRWTSGGLEGGLIAGTIGMFLLFLFGLSILAGVLSALTHASFSRTADQWIVMGGAIVLAALWLRSRIRKKRPKPLSGDHICTSVIPARIRTFDAASVTFMFVRQAYAEAFAAANQTLRVEHSTMGKEVF